MNKLREQFAKCTIIDIENKKKTKISRKGIDDEVILTNVN